jgi:hypothetical protein
LSAVPPASLPGPIGQLASVFYYPLLSTVVLLGALWLVWHGLLQRRATTAAGGLAWMVVAIAVAAWFLAAPATILGGANSVSVQASRSVLSVGGTVDPKAGPADPTTAQATYGGNAGDTELRLAANRFFQTYVYTPWAVGEFGSADAAAGYAPDILKAKTEGASSLSLKQDPSCPVVTCPPLVTGPEPGFRLYQTTVKRIGLVPNVNSWFSGHQAGARLGIAILALLVILMAGSLMLAVVGAVLFAQLALLLLVMLAPFAFLAGVNPAWRHVLTRWAELAVGALLKRILYAGALAVMLVISGVLLAATAPLGWLGAAALQVALVGTAVVYRKRIMRVAGRMTTPSFGAGTAMLGGAALATAGGAGAGLKVASTLYTAKTISRGARGPAHTARHTAGKVGRLAGTATGAGAAATAATGIFSGGGMVLTAALVRRVIVPLRRLRNGPTPATPNPSPASHPDRRSYGAPPPRDPSRPLTRAEREERARRRRDASEARQADRRRREK